MHNSDKLIHINAFVYCPTTQDHSLVWGFVNEKEYVLQDAIVLHILSIKGSKLEGLYIPSKRPL